MRWRSVQVFYVVEHMLLGPNCFHILLSINFFSYDTILVFEFNNILQINLSVASRAMMPVERIWEEKFWCAHGWFLLFQFRPTIQVHQCGCLQMIPSYFDHQTVPFRSTKLFQMSCLCLNLGNANEALIMGVGGGCKGRLVPLLFFS